MAATKPAFTAFESFKWFGIYVDAYTNEKGEIKKRVIMPPKHGQKDVILYDKLRGKMLTANEINGIAIQTLESNLSTIDIDRPEKCTILPQLLNDCKFYVKTRQGYHFYFNYTDKVPRMKLCGIADINTQLLFYVPEYKHRNDEKQVFNYTLANNEAIVDMPQYAIDWCNTLIAVYADDKKDKPKIVKDGMHRVIKPDHDVELFDIEALEIIYNIYLKHEKGFNTYTNWIKMGYMSRHLNNTEEAFKLYDKYCRKVSGYENEPEINNRKVFYGHGEYDLNFNFMPVLMKCRRLDLDTYNKFLAKYYKSKYDDTLIKFNTQFIYPSPIFQEWQESYKVLAIRSPYGTGKTYAFKRLIDTYNPIKILFLTYRQSLAYSLELELKDKYNFINYLENHKVVDDTVIDIREHDRVICQIDSIGKLIGVEDEFTNYDGYPEYDLIVLDELEGLLNHLSFNKMNQYFICSSLEKLLNKGKKILALDGDMNDRSYDFLSAISPSNKFYYNEYRTIQKHFIFTRNDSYFQTCIEEDLKSKKKLVIVSMTKSQTEYYNDKHKDIYNVILHNSIERNKEILQNVKENWAKCDLLIYSPSVESGVDFDVKEYFDKCYCVVSDSSTSYRALGQMLNRVRYYKDNNILCNLNGLYWNPDNILYTYQEMRMNKYNGLKPNILLDVLIHNDTEKMNSNNYFISSFIHFIKEKGHTYTYLDDKQEVPEKYDVAELIAQADNITDAQFEALQKQMKHNVEIGRNKHYSYQKMMFKKVFLLNDINEVNSAFLEEHQYLLHVPKNFKSLFKTSTDIQETDYLQRFEANKSLEIKKLVNSLGFELHKFELTKTNDIDIEECRRLCHDFLVNKHIRTLFNETRSFKVGKAISNANSVLKHYGIEIQTIKTSKKDNGKVKTIYTQELTQTKVIAEYIERKLQFTKSKQYDDTIDYNMDI